MDNLMDRFKVLNELLEKILLYPHNEKELDALSNQILMFNPSYSSSDISELTKKESFNYHYDLCTQFFNMVEKEDDFESNSDILNNLLEKINVYQNYSVTKDNFDANKLARNSIENYITNSLIEIEAKYK